MIAFAPSWKLAAQIVAVCGAIGFATITVFGADSASKPAAVKVSAKTVARKTPPSGSPATVPASAEDTLTDVSAGSGRSRSSGGSGFSGGDGGGSGTDLGAAATDAAAAIDATVPPTVSESSVPLALPISAVVVVGVGAGATWARRRRRNAEGLAKR